MANETDSKASFIKIAADLRQATLDARLRTGDARIGVKVLQGKLQVCRYRTLRGNPWGKCIPISEWLTMDDTIAFLNQMTRGV